MKLQIHMIIILTLLIFSSFPSNGQIDDEWQKNFEFDVLIAIGLPHREALGNYIKAALYPLGIDVNVRLTLPTVTAILYLEADSIIARSVSLIPHTDPRLEAPYGHSAYGYLVDNQTNQDLLDTTIEDIMAETDMNTYITKYNEYRENYYFDNILEGIPLVRERQYLFYPKELIGLEPNIGFSQSILNGMRWDSSVNDQKNSTIKINSWLFFASANNHDPFMYDFGATMSSLVKLDPNLIPHPNLAITWERSDWITEDGEIIKDGKHTFVLREDAYWKQTIPSSLGNYSDFTHKISPRDFGFGFDMFRPYMEMFVPNVNGTEMVDKRITTFSHYDVNETSNSISFYNRYPSAHDIIILSNLTPLPEFHLNQTIVYNSTIQMNPYDMLSLTPKYSVLSRDRVVPLRGESMWEFWNNPISIGAFTLDLDSSLNFREDYWWPNEWDSPNQDFILHEEGSEDPYFYIYNATSENLTQKPTKTRITRIETINNYGSELFDRSLFLNGQMDITVRVGGYNTIETIVSLLENPNFKNQQYYNKYSGQILWFSDQSRITNPDLSNINVRKAIAHAIDRLSIVNAFHGQLEEVTDVTFPYTNFYTDLFTQKYPYDYTIARDLMRDEGYWARDEAILDPPKIVDLATEITVPGDGLPINPFSFFLGLLISVKVIKRRRKGN